MQSNSLGIPIAIVIAGAFIALAVYFTGGTAPATPTALNTAPPAAPEAAATPVPPVTAEDHIRGNPNAPIVIIEYSDFDCPFCKSFHDTMNRIMAKYGVDGKVAWVFRQLPIASLHPNAHRVAEASECVADLAGNDAFWEFSDLAFGERGTNEPTNMTRLTEFAVTAGADEAAFNECLQSGRFADKVEASVREGFAAGANGTPHSFVVVGNQQGPINGAQPYETVSQIVEGLLSQIEGTTIDIDASESDSATEASDAS